MTQLFVNNFRTRLAAPLAANATVMYLENAAGLPAMAPADNNTLNVTLFRSDGFKESGWEVVTITSRVGNACTIIRSTEGAAPSLFAVENTSVEARFTAGSFNSFKDSWLSINGGLLKGQLVAPSFTAQSTLNNRLQKTYIGATDLGNPHLSLSRWSGVGTDDLVWRIVNDGGMLRFSYSAVGAAQAFSHPLTITTQEAILTPMLRARMGVYVGDVDPAYPVTGTAFLPWDGINPVATEQKEVMRLRVQGIPGVAFTGAFRFYTSSGPSFYNTGYALTVFGYDTQTGQAADPVLKLTGTGTLTTRGGINAVRHPLSTLNTGAGEGWMKIAKIKKTILGSDVVIRVSGTSSYTGLAGNSNAALTTIIARVDNDSTVRGSFYTEGLAPYGTPTSVVFGNDGTVYLLAGTFYQLSVHIDAHPQAWEPQEVAYYSATAEVPVGIQAIRAWAVRLGNSPTFTIGTANIDTVCNFNGRNVTPSITNTYALGSGAYAYTTVYTSTGSISASDARLKRDFRDFTAPEIQAACDIARAIGVYRWKDSVASKAADAREHIGPTVQRAIEIMASYGLDPFNYGFICHDVWDREVIEHPAIEARAAVPATDEVLAEVDEDGAVITDYVPANPGYPAVEGRDAYIEVIREAGDRYAFRYDELAMFIAAGQEARLTALETR